jgi:hypothetical protein
MVRRRPWLVAAAGALAGPILNPRTEARVSTLYFDKIDDELFPDLLVPPGQKAIRARVLPPPADRRIPAPPQSVVLLVAYRLDEPGVSTDPAVKPPAWQLAYEVLDKDGKPHRHGITLMERPLEGNFSERPTPVPGMVMPPGMIYRGAYWTTLTELYRTKTLRPGMPVELSYGQQARVRLTLP